MFGVSRNLATASQRAVNCCLTQMRGYRAHALIQDDRISRGRSIAVQGKAGAPELNAYSRLRNVLTESKVRDIVRSQERHERKHDEKRRKKKEKLFRDYLQFMKKKIDLAYDLKKKWVDVCFLVDVY